MKREEEEEKEKEEEDKEKEKDREEKYQFYNMMAQGYQFIKITIRYLFPISTNISKESYDHFQNIVESS